MNPHPNPSGVAEDVLALKKRLLALTDELHANTGISRNKCEAKISTYVDVLAAQLIQYWKDHDGNFVYLNTTELRNRLGYIYSNQKRYYIYEEIKRCKWSLFDPIVLGLRGQNYTGCRLKNSVKYDAIVMASGNIQEIVEHLYGDTDPDQEIDWIPVDLASLASFVRATTQDHYRGISQTILLISEHFDGYMPHVRVESDFGRLYYRGINFQNMKKTVRHAALGDCYQWDIENSVWAWKNHLIKQIYQEAGATSVYYHTENYIERKKSIRRTLAREIFPELHQTGIDVVKHALTAISFGATVTGSISWGREPGSRIALNQIIKSPEKLVQFIDHELVAPLIQEQTLMNQDIRAYVKHQGLDTYYKQFPQLVDGRNRLRTNSLISWMYQHAERELIEGVKQRMSSAEPLLTVHDCIYTRRRPSASCLVDVKQFLQQTNPEVKLEETKVTKWTWIEDQNAHKERIQQEEQLAQGYTSPVIITDGAPVTPAVEQRITKHDGEYQAYTGSGEHSYDPDLDPWLDDYEPPEIVGLNNSI